MPEGWSTAGTAASIPRTTFVDFPPARGGHVYRVFVYAPPGEPPAAGWPTLYMTDGNAVIATAVEALRAQAAYPGGTNVGQGIVVAVGYPTDAPYDPLRRSWDLGPPPGRTYPTFQAGGPPVRTGGAEAFLAFLVDDLGPRIAVHHPVDPSRQALFGHSFGGLFALYALFRRPSAFRTWLPASPAIFWEDGLIHRYREAFAADPPADLDIEVRLSAGEYEGDGLAPFQLGKPDEEKRLSERRAARTVGRAEEMAEYLAGLAPGRISARFELHAAENHMSVLPVAVNRAVQAAFAVDRGNGGGGR